MTSPKGIEIRGRIFPKQDGQKHEEFIERLIEFIEKNGWFFEGDTLSIDQETIALNETKPYDGKYVKLYNYLIFKKDETATLKLTFDELEEIIGFPLPHSAYHYPAWWANQRFNTQARSWNFAGWKTSNVKPGESVEFIR
ncbi:DUF7662 domain-containing protein [Bacillus massiliglaciei]|uniref:DUF7662 domain-containing protein n=1 Tax=Bacillus massiliglaciei TaxID=1816693 RepID=UPI000DA632E6|nr:hypothetical protein [Bacillus massiliglaciei]